MMQLVFFLEGPSEEALLSGMLPELLPHDVKPRYVVFEGKQDLEKRLVKRMRGWCMPDTCFVVLRDKDAGDCMIIKERLQALCNEAGHHRALVRIACHEIESWYLGDLSAVEQGLSITGIARHQKKAKFRDPDRLANAAKELTAITKGRYQKLSGSRQIGRCISLEGNKSTSFNLFISGIQRVISEAGHI
ncbi:MAG: DUF4276 family protein [Candidatus Polarisedimenticolaceae bacterium]|nr:DUF4276 family protein [Candidatus Polarisedimenticolaceae bacterium]